MYDEKDSAQMCLSTGEIVEMQRCGCKCGCTAKLGFLKIDASNISKLKQSRWDGTAQEFFKSVWIDAV